MAENLAKLALNNSNNNDSISNSIDD